MFGVSLGKVLFTVLVVAVVWGAFKYYSRALGGSSSKDRPSLRQRVEKAAQDAVRKRMSERGEGSGAPPAEDLVRCPNCGAWHAPGARCDCGYGR
ncbi:hypothetical protein [uncultured Rhodospira sp.]|uniref:hypothetical protein n=1 Tax=uncultured Rhodospira sp. TaxID=1936189 RepID=UPI00260E130E|nr:hypothetical protein [uncultured Rhodospira sp.]